MSQILAIETATDACSVAVINNDGAIAFKHDICPRKHAEQVFPMIQSVLSELKIDKAQLDAVAFGQGPGSFLGTRIAAGVAQGLGYALEIPLIPVSTLACLAEQATRRFGEKRVLAAWDARMGQIYYGEYQEAVKVKEGVAHPVEMHADEGVFFIGNAWAVYFNDYSPTLQTQIKGQDQGAFVCYPDARDILSIAQIALKAGQVVSPADAEPIYYRDAV